MRPLVVLLVVAVVVGLSGCWGEAADSTGEPQVVASVPGEGLALVYEIRPMDTPFPVEIDRMAAAFGIPDDAEREWCEWDSDNPDAIGVGGAGDAPGDVVAVHATEGSPGWLFNSAYWNEIDDPSCDACEPLTGWTVEEALAETERLMDEIDQDFDGKQWSTRVDDETISVSGYPVVDGAVASGQLWQFVFGADGELYRARGYLVELVPVGAVVRLSPAEALAGRPEGTWDDEAEVTPTVVRVAGRPFARLFPGYEIELPGVGSVNVPAYAGELQPVPKSMVSTPVDRRDEFVSPTDWEAITRPCR